MNLPANLPADRDPPRKLPQETNLDSWAGAEGALGWVLFCLWNKHMGSHWLIIIIIMRNYNY